MRSYYVYTLSHSGRVFYVGITQLSLNERLYSHLSEIKRSGASVYRYIKSKSIVPEIEEVETIVSENRIDVEQAELFWIEQFRQWGFALYNGNKFFGRSAYCPTWDETVYGLYENKRGRKPKSVMWVEVWLKHPAHPSKHIVPPKNVNEIRRIVMSENKSY